MASMAMVAQVDSKAADGGLAQVFKLNRVNDLLVQEFEKEEVQSLAEFAAYFTNEKYEEEAKTFRDRVESLKTKGVEVARLRTAILMARAVLARPEPAAESQSQAAAAVDMEGPLPSGAKEDMATAWTQRYGVTLTMHLDPADPLVNRLYREFRQNAPSLIHVQKVKSIYTDHNPHPEKKVALSGGLVLTVEGKERDEAVRSVAQYYFALRILENASAKAGNYEWDSKVEKGTKVIFAPLDTNLDYADHAFRMTLKQPGTAAFLLRWIEDRDHATRGHMCTLMRGGYSQGEALLKAMREMEYKWVSHDLTDMQGGDGQKRGRSHSPPRGQSSGRPMGNAMKRRKNNPPVGKFATSVSVKYASMAKGGKKICRAYNDGSCNKDPCPHGGLHVCSVVHKGAACGMRHPATRHQFGR